MGYGDWESRFKDATCDVLKNRNINNIYIDGGSYNGCQMIDKVSIGTPSFLRLMKMEKRKGFKNKSGLVFPKKWGHFCSVCALF